MAITLEEIKQRQAQLHAMIVALQYEQDPNRLIATSEAIAVQARQFEAMTVAFGEQERAAAGPQAPPNIVRVQLTDAQRLHVQEQTGVRIEVLDLEDGKDVMEGTMPQENPALIERLAIEEALRRRIAAQKEEAMKQQATAAVNDVAAVGNPDLNKILAEKLADPNFLAGMMQKK